MEEHTEHEYLSPARWVWTKVGLPLDQNTSNYSETAESKQKHSPSRGCPVHILKKCRFGPVRVCVCWVDYLTWRHWPILFCLQTPKQHSGPLESTLGFGWIFVFGAVIGPRIWLLSKDNICQSSLVSNLCCLLHSAASIPVRDGPTDRVKSHFHLFNQYEGGETCSLYISVTSSSCSFKFWLKDA